MARVRLHSGTVSVALLAVLFLLMAYMVLVRGASMNRVVFAALGLLIPVAIVGIVLRGVWSVFAG